MKSARHLASHRYAPIAERAPSMPSMVGHGEKSDDARHDWRVAILPAGSPETEARIADLLGSGPGVSACADTLLAQLSELMEIRWPTLDSAGVARAVQEYLGGVPPERYGNWIHYPWRRQLVHVLPEAEFIEVRLARNRNKITTTEQARLRALHIAIVGLSVGQATAVTLAMEGIGGSFALADFDALSLSNMNRLRSSVADIGINKAVLTARSLLEIDPYLRIHVEALGLHADNIDAFLSAPRPDVIIEECDDIPMKFLVREAARQAGIPVVMETSDRGMLDVERFDLDPNRAIFHGLTTHTSGHDLRGASPTRKLQAAMAIVGLDTVSPRLAASAMEIGRSLRSWPQLASAVSLGAAVVTDTVRRIALDEFRASGRYYVDLEDIVCDPATRNEPPPEPVAPGTPSPTPRPPHPETHDGLIRFLVEHGIAAPSGGNAQPWSFDWDGTTLHCLRDPTRGNSLLDYAHRATWLAFGAMAENIVLAATARGLTASVRRFPDGVGASVVCAIEFDRDTASSSLDPLADQILCRCTNRRLGKRDPLPPTTVSSLRHAALERGASIRFIEDPSAMEALGRVLGAGDRIRFLSRTLHAELMAELRWSTSEAERARDGIDLRTLELDATDMAALRLTARWRVMELLGRLGGGANLEVFGQRVARGSSAFGSLSLPGDDAAAFFEGGRAVQRVWLTATALGIGFQPLAALPYLFMRAEAGGDGLATSETRSLLDLQPQYRVLTAVPDGHADVLLFRLARVGAPAVRALRRPVDDVLRFSR
jgi:molybdopterin/thiamine biosynthesis adenylyltransferase/nitroreductase